MWDSLRGNKKTCGALRDALEAVSERRREILVKEDLLAELPQELLAHLSSCAECGQDLDNLLATRNVLHRYAPIHGVDAPWFAGRVMATISAQERVRAGQEIVWSVVPRLASRFAAVAALGLILASGWLIRLPEEKTTAMATVEGLFDTSQAPATRDDVLASVLEKER
ncbi:MAG: hypothetical protein PVS2B2_18790 [Candidatus Acidiferrum sp.]